MSRRLLTIFILTATLFLRLYHLDYHDLWYDEIHTTYWIQVPWVIWNSWTLLHFWTKLLGLSEFCLRLPSAIFSFLSVILTFCLGKLLFNKKVGIVASILIGLSPFHLWYGQEARDYALALFLGILISYLFFRAIKGGELRLWLAFVLFSVYGLFISYFFIVLLATQGLYLIFVRKLRSILKEIVYFLIIALGFIFSLRCFIWTFSYMKSGFWIPRPTGQSLIITLENFILGYNGFPLIYFVSNVLTVIFLVSALWAARNKELKEQFIFCAFLLFIPILFVFVFSKLFFSIYLDRGLIIFSPYLYLILSLGLNHLKKTIKLITFFVLISILFISDYRYFNDLLFLPISHHVGVYLKKPIKPVAGFIKENLEPQDIIIFTNECALLPFDFYIKKKSYPIYLLFDPGIRCSITQKQRWQKEYTETNYCIDVHKINQLQFRRMWVISSDWARSGNLDENSQAVKDRLDKYLKLEFSTEFEGLRIFRYVKSHA